MKIFIFCSFFFWGISAGALGQEVSGVKTFAFEPTDSKRDREVPVKIYLTDAQESKPVILFSHGLGGSRNNNPYLGNHWANAGYVVVFMQHIGSDESVWKGVPMREIMPALKSAASREASVARIADVKFVLDQLERWNVENGHELHEKLDLEHIGLCGHSFGAVTTQALMGQKKRSNPHDAADERIDAFLPMSPSQSVMMSPKESFGAVKAPVLCMTGTKDGNPIVPTSPPELRLKVYQGLPAGDKYQLVFKDGQHHAFAGGASGAGRLAARTRIPHHHPAILEISTGFWNAYLKNDSSAKNWLQSEKVRDDANLVEEDTWEWK